MQACAVENHTAETRVVDFVQSRQPTNGVAVFKTDDGQSSTNKAVAVLTDNGTVSPLAGRCSPRRPHATNVSAEMAFRIMAQEDSAIQAQPERGK